MRLAIQPASSVSASALQTTTLGLPARCRRAVGAHLLAFWYSRVDLFGEIGPLQLAYRPDHLLAVGEQAVPVEGVVVGAQHGAERVRQACGIDQLVLDHVDAPDVHVVKGIIVMPAAACRAWTAAWRASCSAVGEGPDADPERP